MASKRIVVDKLAWKKLGDRYAREINAGHAGCRARVRKIAKRTLEDKRQNRRYEVTVVVRSCPKRFR